MASTQRFVIRTESCGAMFHHSRNYLLTFPCAIMPDGTEIQIPEKSFLSQSAATEFVNSPQADVAYAATLAAYTATQERIAEAKRQIEEKARERLERIAEERLDEKARTRQAGATRR